MLDVREQALRDDGDDKSTARPRHVGIAQGPRRHGVPHHGDQQPEKHQQASDTQLGAHRNKGLVDGFVVSRGQLDVVA